MELRFDLEGLDAEEQRLVRLIAALRDLRLFWPRVVPLAIRWISQQFETEGRYFGEPWEPLSDDYAAWKMEHYPGRRILQAQGDLRRAATTPRRIAEPQRLILQIESYQRTDRQRGGSREIDPGWFQEGTSRMPARRIVPALEEPFPPSAVEELDAVARDWIEELGRALGLRAA